MTTLERLKEQYEAVLSVHDKEYRQMRMLQYNAVRVFCLDLGLISFKEIERMEFELNKR